MIVVLLLLLIGLIAFVMAAFGVGHPRINLLAIGLAAWIGAVILEHLP